MLASIAAMAVPSVSWSSRRAVMIIARASAGWLIRTRFQRCVLVAWSENV
jgi:hypothetical protein